MLESHGIAFTYREYTKEPLSEVEIEDILQKLKLEAAAIVRSRDAKKLGLTGNESPKELIALMAANPKLMQRPIGVSSESAVVGRPPEALLSLV